jgi:MULE transposase domain
MTPFSSNKINLPISKAPNPDQKRHLLFNVEKPLELSIEDFDKNWWPLVSNIWCLYSYKNNVNGNSWKVFLCRFNKHYKSSTRKEDVSHEKRHVTKVRPANLCSAKIKIKWLVSEKKVQIERFGESPNHSHPIEDSEKLKRSQVVRDLVIQEAIKNYRPPEIVSAVKEYATEELNLGKSVKELSRKEVTNIKYKVHGSIDIHLIGNPKQNQDIKEAISFLKNKEYLVNYYEISHQSTYGLVFIHPNQLRNLEQYGWLTLIDSTHKTNRYDCRLFTLYIRNYYGCWDVGAHFFISNEDSITVTEGLKIVRLFANHWNPRYFLSDQSNIESNSIKAAFPGLQNGEQECDIIFCTVHVMRTWMSKVYDKKTRQKMILAMHKRTKIGCEELVQQAINECENPIIQRYISRNYTRNMHQWALCARQHSPLLLQVTSTNALESYHSELKRTTSSQHGLIGPVYLIFFCFGI